METRNAISLIILLTCTARPFLWQQCKEAVGPWSQSPRRARLQSLGCSCLVVPVFIGSFLVLLVPPFCDTGFCTFGRTPESKCV
jgi:hypothetical protein